MKLVPLKEEDTKEKKWTEASSEGESALFGFTNAALQEQIRSATEYGYVTYDQVDALLSRDDIRSEQIEDIWRKLARWVWA